MSDKIPFEDFAKLELKVGKINSLEPHPNADKLFVMKVDLGETSERTIVAGLRGFYSADELEGRQAVFVVNLEPREVRGVKSEGMILAASNERKEKVVFLTPEKEMNPGDKIS